MSTKFNISPRSIRLILAAAAVLVIGACSTTKVLSEGQYRLAKNKVHVTNDKSFNANAISPYIKQAPNSYFIGGWNPFLCVYNWQNGKGKGWDKFVKKIGVPPVIFDSTLVSSSETNIAKRLDYLGYYNSNVESEIIHKGKEGKKVIVDYNVTLGDRIPISDVTIDIAEGELKDAFMADINQYEIKPGDYLSEAKLEDVSVRASDILREQGFFRFNKNYFFFEADTLGHSDSASLIMSIKDYTRNETPSQAKPHNRYRINNVSVSYPTTLKLRDRLLYDLNTIKPGNYYSEHNVSNTYSRLSSIRLFNSVNIEMNEVGDSLVDCNISLTPSKLQGFKLNAEVSVNSTGLIGISPQLSYYHKNIFRGGEWLNLGFMGNFQFKTKEKIHSNEFGVSAGLIFPRFLGVASRHFKGPILPKTEINISYNFQNRPEYTRNMISAGYGYQGSYKSKLFYQFNPLQLNIVNLSELDEEFYKSIKDDPFMRNAYQNHFDLGIGCNLYYTTNPAANPASTFFYTRFQFDLSGNLLSAFKPIMSKDENGVGMVWNTPYSQYVRSELTIGKTWVFGRKDGQAIATRLMVGAGYAYGNTSALPFEKHFYAGGASSLRGWQARTVGPGMSQRDSTFIIPNQTGDFKLEANIEYRFHMFWKFAGTIFADAGNIWMLRETSTDPLHPAKFTLKNAAKGIAANWGVGLRLDFGFMLLRLDCGFKIHDPARNQHWVHPRDWFRRNGYALHFGVGYPF